MKARLVVLASVFAMGSVFVSCSQSGNKTESKADVAATQPTDLTGFKVDLDASKVLWSGTSLGIYTHTGTLDFVNAEVSIKDGKIVGGDFTVDVTSMTPTDENFNPEAGYSKEKLIGHLSSPDFFDVDNFPDASFTIESVEGNSAKGLLTIRGITHEEMVENIQVSEENGKTVVSGDLVFDRKKYDIKWDYPTKDKLLKKEIELKIKLVSE